ncbi:MAG: peroxiredoxin [Pseudomonadota bacterium]
MTRLLAAGLLALLHGAAAAAPPAAGEPAPPFRLQDQAGEWHALADYRGSWVALYFYPRDDTPGCTTQACAFRDDIFEFRKRGIRIVGISLDDSASHARFAEKHSLPFTLLADTEHEAAEAYGVLGSFGMVKVAKRQSFLIDPDGRIAVHYAEVDANTNSQQMLADADRLIATD